MRRVIIPAAAVLLVVLNQVVLADQPREERGEEQMGLEQKMLGAWKGQTGCAGNFLFRADRTYELSVRPVNHVIA